jgi:hypothetical protein
MATIKACQNCGSRRIRGATVADGGLAGVTDGRRWVCERCGHQGQEMLFEDEDARQAYARAQREGSGIGEGEGD